MEKYKLVKYLLDNENLICIYTAGHYLFAFCLQHAFKTLCVFNCKNSYPFKYTRNKVSCEIMCCDEQELIKGSDFGRLQCALLKSNPEY